MRAYFGWRSRSRQVCVRCHQIAWQEGEDNKPNTPDLDYECRDTNFGMARGQYADLITRIPALVGTVVEPSF